MPRAMIQTNFLNCTLEPKKKLSCSYSNINWNMTKTFNILCRCKLGRKITQYNAIIHFFSKRLLRMLVRTGKHPIVDDIYVRWLYLKIAFGEMKFWSFFPVMSSLGTTKLFLLCHVSFGRFNAQLLTKRLILLVRFISCLHRC